MDTYHIHITGIVQGVGFRPFVYKQAIDFGLKGWVNNSLDGVHIEFSSNEEEAHDFYDKIIKRAPGNARIYNHTIQKVAPVSYHTFDIIRSQDSGDPDIPLTPDFALCPTCRKEIKDANNRRHQYPFTTCTYCGPRYSIAQKLPYDRHTTTMKPFVMCKECQNEYENPLDRRYYSQTNSCKTCGIDLSFVSLDQNKNVNSLSYDKIINKVTEYLEQGKIIAIKGIGGYLLVCDASNHQAIKTLRERKHRPTKPFAVMYPDIKALEKEFKINNSETEALTNEVASIVLLQKKNNVELSINADSIAPGISRIGCMIPYAPIYQIILDQFKKPIIATSGNISGSPIIYENDTALNELRTIADALVINNRAIVTPQDDSVVSFTALNNQKIIHRRSRGLAPTYENSPFPSTKQTLIALGAQMKSSFTILIKNRVYVSQYLGDMDSYLTQNAYRHTLEHLQSILACTPDLFLADKHPLYFTSGLAKEKSEVLQVPLYQYQHHKAHFTAVLAENNLLEYQKPIMGVVWDGTGFGDDNNIWGGEFFTFQDQNIIRSSHIGYFPFILGDKMPREPRISALCASFGLNDVEKHLRPKFSPQEWNIYLKLLTNHSGLMTTSMGRLFDAVASLLLNIDKITYEGEAAIWLESHAETYAKSEKITFDHSYLRGLNNLPKNVGQYLIMSIFNELKKGVATNKIAYCFHISLVDLIRKVTTRNAIHHIAFSGGVFQNKLLTDMMISLLSKDFRLFFHQQLSPNDECVSFGQLACYFLFQNEPTHEIS